MDNDHIVSILRNYESRLQKLETIHTRYQGNQGPQGLKGDKGDKGADADLAALHAEMQAVRDELHAFKAEIHAMSVTHLNALDENYRRYETRLHEIFTEEVESFCTVRNEAAKRNREN